MAKRTLDEAGRIGQSLTTTFGKTIWKPFTQAIRKYELIEPGDRIAVCISGGKDSMLLALLMQMLQKNGPLPFGLTFLVMDPGYAPENRARIEQNAARLGIPVTIFETNIFRVAANTKNNPCFLCAKMRRGHLYQKAQALGCNKIALGHHYNDVIETTVMGMFYGAQLQTMIPKLHSQNFPGMELIRPLYCVREEAILEWVRASGLHFLQCACQLTRDCADGVGDSKRQETKALLARLKETNPNIEKNIFHSIHTVCLHTFPEYKIGKEKHSFLETYDDGKNCEKNIDFSEGW